MLCTIAIVATLIGLALPAIQAAREAARAAQCKDNLKNLGLGATHHVNAYASFPSGGWGWDWVGDPDFGFLEKQPGGWVYNVLPFIEQKSIWSIGKGLDFAARVGEKKFRLSLKSRARWLYSTVRVAGVHKTTRIRRASDGSTIAICLAICLLQNRTTPRTQEIGVRLSSTAVPRRSKQ